jgi:nitroreductase
MTADAPWTPDAAAFPAEGTDADRLRFLVRYAVLAPSDRNTQPWLFHVAGDALELRADRTRALPVGDPDGRTLTISCGAALYHLRLAARHFGYAGAVERLPDAADPDLLARLRLGGRVAPVASDEALFHAIPERRTNRRPFREGFVPYYLLDAFDAAANEEGAWISFLSEPTQKNVLADLIAEGGRVQLEDPELRAERATWIRPASGPTHDGLSGYSLGIPPPLDFATPIIAAAVRRPAFAEVQATLEAERAAGAGVLAVLGTSDDTPEAWLRAGEALARVLLRATAAGVSASFLNVAVEVPALRDRLNRLIGLKGAPQLLFRLGFGPELRPAPRRSAPEVMEA